ncbi:MAG: Crp/Fnr family transcriptional regulator [Bacteroidales bacterium]|nr:Crp/Fnr family transcriptional regulator [Bacteroidota bacterium]MBL6949399.1 Crp/Fnr family transcriptional regulator [Bacteroidales bacterium]
MTDKKEQYSGCTISTHRCKCFDLLTDEEKRQLETHSVRITYKKGESICKQGSFASHVMYVERGLVKVFLDNGVNLLVLKIIPDCNLLGLTSVNEENNTFQYSAMAYIDTEIVQIDINFFKKLLNQNPAFSKEIINILSSNSIQINGRFFCLTHKQSYGRLADILLCLSDRIFKKTEFELPLSRKELAELSGMSSETVIRMLKKFNEDELIQLDGKRFKVLDYSRLQRISETG